MSRLKHNKDRFIKGDINLSIKPDQYDVYMDWCKVNGIEKVWSTPSRSAKFIILTTRPNITLYCDKSDCRNVKSEIKQLKRDDLNNRITELQSELMKLED